MKETLGDKLQKKVNRINALRRVTPVIRDGQVWYQVEGKAPLYADRKEAFRVARSGPTYAEMCAAQLQG